MREGDRGKERAAEYRASARGQRIGIGKGTLERDIPFRQCAKVGPEMSDITGGDVEEFEQAHEGRPA